MNYKYNDNANHGKSKKLDKVYLILDKYFKLLDEEPINSDGLFSSVDDKEKYETTFMYAFRKYQAALYHFENVKRLDSSDFEKAGIDQIANSKISKSPFLTATKTSFSANYYVYELSAFLEAVKSCLDFLAAAIECQLKGIQLDSITTLKKLAKGGRRKYIYGVVYNNFEWIEEISNYRHHLVHRRIITTSYSIERKRINKTEMVYVHPVLVPKSPPKYCHDTRRSRGFEDLPSHNIGYIETKAEVNGIKKIHIEYIYPEDYMAIEDFMEYHCNNLSKFFIEFINELIKLKFKII